MAILNQAEIEALIASRFADNATGDITPEDMRDHAQDHLDSLQSYGGVVLDGNSPTNSITATPTLWTRYTSNATSANALLEADYANGRIKVFQPGVYLVTLRTQGKWATNEDLTREVYVNGAANAVTPITFAQEGAGASDPAFVSSSRVTFIITSTMIAAGPGGAFAEVGLYLSSTTGTFNYEQDDITFGLEYNPLSIRTVG